MPRFPALAGLALIASAACQPVADRPAQPDDCNSAAYQSLVGTAVEAADFSGHPLVRIIPPNSAVTMDYRAERLNVEIDETGLIQRLYCG